ncbi:MAG: glycosyltransferase family 2 protein [Aquirhabdus sp.]
MLNTTSAMHSVAILMCTYNGEKYLEEQLQSFEQQTHQNWKLFVSDDGSKDRTLEILKTYQAKWGEEQLIITNGPRKGFAPNFLSITCNSTIRADYYAYSDQDDIWCEDKLARAVNELQTKNNDIPLLYCTRTQLIDNNKTTIGYSQLFAKRPDFRNALVQSLAGGNTMVFNNVLKNLAITAGADINVVFHDWWLYIVATACGGSVIYDITPSLLYRQHDQNLVGSNYDMAARLNRLKMLRKGQYRQWNTDNIFALSPLKNHITKDNLKILNQFRYARQAWFLERLFTFIRIGLYRQTKFGTLSLIFAIIFNRI